MRASHIIRFVASAVLGCGAVLISTSAGPASAEPCPDVEAVFARGTGEPPGVGGVGQSFVDSLRAQLVTAQRNAGVASRQLDIAGNGVDNTVVRAPFAGV